MPFPEKNTTHDMKSAKYLLSSHLLKIVYVLTYCLLPVFGTAVFGVSENLLARLTYFIVSVLCLGGLVAWAKNTRQLMIVTSFFSIGAWYFLALLIKHRGVPVVLLWDIVRGNGWPEVHQYLTAHGLVFFVFAVLCGAILAFYFSMQVPRFSLSANMRKNALAGVTICVAISMQWDHFPWRSPPFVSPVSDLAACEIYPVALAKLLWSGGERILNSKPPAGQFHAVRHQVPIENETYVLIIGESARYDRWHLHGYQRQTSPNLEMLPASELLDFQKAHGGGNLTIQSVPILLSGVLPEHFSPLANKPTVLDLMKEAGFVTMWFSNQDDAILKMVNINADILLHRDNNMRVPDYLFEKTRFDEDLLESLDSALAYGSPKKFIVLHTSGSHFEYDLKVPDKFKKFSIKIDGMYSETNFSHKQDAYDNTILYTDWLISQVIQKLKAAPGLASVTYMSDHGEILYDDKDKINGHGTNASSAVEQHIPWFFWGNQAFRTHYQLKWEHLMQHRNQHFGGENYLATWSDLLDISYPAQNLALSLAQEQFLPRKNARVLGANNNLVAIQISD